jgi:sporulation protein YlmC with PRC-barrel domain
MILACSSEPRQSSKIDPSLEKIAGKDYAKIIEIPTTPEGLVDTSKTARIDFEYEVFNFDTIYQGDVVQHTFNFKNTGIKPLYILQTNSSCGCTVPSYSKEPLPPGESESITVEFNSAGKSGDQNRKISVITNAYPSEKIIRMKGYVKQMD